MKKYLLIIGFLLTSFVSFSQVIPKPNPTAVGIGYKRLLADSTIFIPTGGAIPRLGSNNINRRSAIYADTINKRLWVFYPNDSTWKESGLTKINWDSVFNKPIYFKTKYDSSTDIKDSILARLAIRDTAAMLAPYVRTGVLAGYVPNTRSLTINGIAQNLSADRIWSIAPGGISGQILSKNSNTDYDYGWIDNFADWTSTVKEYVKVGQDITKGQAVYVSSSDGTNIIVSKASNVSEATSSKVIGLLAQTLSTNGKGYVITEGLLSGLNTASATTGDPVWLGVDGNLIYGLTNKPYAPAHLVYIGVVVRSNSSNGEIFIQPQNGFELRELHDVSAQSPSNNDGLFYNSSNSLWETKSIATALGYTPANAATYVPYTGATANLNLGNNGLLIGTGSPTSSSHIDIIGQSATAYVNMELAGGKALYGMGYIKYQGKQTAYQGSKTINFSAPLTTGNDYNIDFPNASGTVALTSDLGSYVTLGTAQTISGAKTFSSMPIIDNGTSGISLRFKQYSNTNFGLAGYTDIIPIGSTLLAFSFGQTGADTKTAYFSAANLTNNTPREYIMPNANGTLALTSDLGNYVTLGTAQTISGIKSFSNRVITGTNTSNPGGSFVMQIGNGSNYVGDASSITMYAPTSSQLMFVYKDASSIIKLVSLSPSQPESSQRYFSWPSSDGQIALTSQIPTVAGVYLPLVGGILTGKLAGVNLEFSNPSAPFVSGGVINSSSTQTIAVPNGSTWSNGSVFSASNNTQILNFAGSQSIQNGSVVAGTVNVNRISFTAGSSTISMAQSTGIRAMAGMQMLQQTGGTINGTVSHGASMFVQGVYPSNTANVTFSNYYGLLMNPLDEWGGVTFTNRWGIYQSGASDKNYFNGNLLIKSTTDNGSALQVTGAATFSSSVTASSFSVSNGSLSNNGYWGTLITAGTGSGFDFGLVRSTSDGIMGVPTGTNNVLFSSNVGVGGIVAMSSFGVQQRFTINSSQSGSGLYFASYLNAANQYVPIGMQFAPGNENNKAEMRMAIDGSDGNTRFSWHTVSGFGALTERMRITSGGNVLIGTIADNGLKFQVQGTIWMNGNLLVTGTANSTIGQGPYSSLINNSNSYQIVQQLNASYNLDFWSYRGGWSNVSRIDGATGIYTPLSDINKKKDFEESKVGLNAILGLKPTLYRMKEEDESIEKHLGFIAQEVKDFIPQAYVEQDNFIGLQDRPIIAALVKAIQEQQVQIEKLKSEIQILKNKQ